MYPKSLKLPLILAIVLASLSSCSPDKSSATKSVEAAVDISEMTPGQLFRGIAEPCAKSDNYQKSEWIDKNDCSWALEKELLTAYPEYGRRVKDNLELQIDNGDWHKLPMSASNDNKAPFYYQWKAYYPKSHYFLIEKVSQDLCKSYLWIDGKTGRQTALKGDLWVSSDSKWMAVVSGTQQNCNTTPSLLSFSKAGKLNVEPLNLGSELSQVGWSKTHVFGKKDANSTAHTFQKLTATL